MRRLPPRSVAAAVLVLAVATAGCSRSGGGSNAADRTTTSATPTSTAPTTGPGSSSPTTGEPGGTGSTTSLPGTTIADADLPGEALDLYPYAGADLIVVGVAADDVLHLRSGPGTDFASVDDLEPTAGGLRATGRNRLLADSAWAEVVVGSTVGWANLAYLAQQGPTADVTADLREQPVTDSVVGLAEAVARLRATEGIEPRIAVVTEPTAADAGLQEITVDVLGVGDDAVAGERLSIDVASVADGMFAVRSVEATTLCSRGVVDGACA